MPAYTALYRQWRPHRFAEMVGQEHVTRTLRNALRHGSVAHAYLFCGPRGTGKTSAARILAAALNCERATDGDPCMACDTCRQIAEDRLLDVQEIDAASNRQVDDVRALRETVGYAPAAGRHKVYILDEVHMLTEASWNTLLKTLEEPPPATTFILCTTDPRHVLGTVISRCQRFDFRRLTSEEIEGQLAAVCIAERIAATPEALAAIARRADGGLRDALAILEQALAFAAKDSLLPVHVAAVLGAADDETAGALLNAAVAGDGAVVFSQVQALYAEGRDMAQVCRDLLETLRDRIVEAMGTGTSTQGRDGSHGGGRVPLTSANLEWLLHTVELLAQAEGQMRRSAQPRLLLEVALLRAMADTRDAVPGPAPGAHPSTRRSPSTDATQAPSSVLAQTSGPGLEAAPLPARAAEMKPPAQTEEGAPVSAPAASGPGPVATGASGLPASAPVTDAAAGIESVATDLEGPLVDDQAAAARDVTLAAAQTLHAGMVGSPSVPSWDRFLDALRKLSLPAHAMLLNAQFLGIHEHTLRLGLPTKAFADRVLTRAQVLEQAWMAAGGDAVHIACTVTAGAGASPPSAAERERRSLRPGARTPPPDSDAQQAPSATREADAAIAAGGAGGAGGAGQSAFPAPATTSAGHDSSQAAFQKALSLFGGEPLPGTSQVGG